MSLGFVRSWSYVFMAHLQSNGISICSVILSYTRVNMFISQNSLVLTIIRSWLDMVHGSN